MLELKLESGENSWTFQLPNDSLTLSLLIRQWWINESDAELKSKFILDLYGAVAGAVRRTVTQKYSGPNENLNHAAKQITDALRLRGGCSEADLIDVDAFERFLSTPKFEGTPCSPSERMLADAEIVRLGQECSHPNWDGYDANAVAAASVTRARQILSKLPAFVPRPEVAVEPEGCITFDWVLKPSGVVTLSVEPTGEVVYASGRRGGRMKALLDDSSALTVEASRYLAQFR